MNINKCGVLLIVFVSYLFSVPNTSTLVAQSVTPGYGHERSSALPPAETPESEGGRIVSRLEFEPLDFVPPKVERVVLENGMIVYILEDHSLPLFDLVARIRTGAVYEPPEKEGLANLAGHVMRSGGTVSMSADTINEELEFIAASVETSIDRESGTAALSVPDRKSVV